MYILGERIYFWDLKKLIQDLQAKPLSTRVQLYYLYLIILTSPIISLISDLDELWGIEWYFALSWVTKFCAVLGLFTCYWSYKTKTQLTSKLFLFLAKSTHRSSQEFIPSSIEGRDVAGTPNNFLSCLISISWVIGFRIFLLLFTGFWLLVLLDNFNLQFLNPDYLLWYLNLWIRAPYNLISGIIILNLIFFSLVSRAIAQVVK